MGAGSSLPLHDTSTVIPAPTRTPVSGGSSSPTPSPGLTVSGVGDLAGGWRPAESDHGAVYKLLIEENGDAHTIGGPGPLSPVDGNKICVGSIEGENGSRFRVELGCGSLADLGGAQDSLQGTAIVEAPPESAGGMWNVLSCDEGPGVLLITWADGFQDALCRTGDTDTTADSGS